MAAIELKNLSKVYDNKVTAVNNADFVINDKEFLVLVGPSGCGKSTLLRMIAGLEDISSGELFIDGMKVNDIAPKDRDIAMVFQNYALYPHMSVFDNMAFGLKMRKFPKDEIKNRVAEASKTLELDNYLDRKPKALSGGQRQRVAIGRAIVRQPKVFLFDEPLSNLDAKLRVQMRIELKELHSRLQATMVYVTHDQIEAMTMGDRIVVLKDGIVQQIDTPLNLYNNPQNLFVAGFIGSPTMNFIPGLIDTKGSGELVFGEMRIQLPESQKEKLLEKGITDYVLGVRVEDVYDLNVENGKSLPGGYAATIDAVEPLGSEIYLYVQCHKLKLCLRTAPDRQYERGQIIHVSFNADKLYFFSQKSGDRIL
ncbi:MAG: sn-glycerol-3-phosphate ABC transporter ATP-binding protein UgpC [Deferribacteres bacterium]|nr:sn-glycerol-3-phosphate ABC transporter ATP-binding protein UgpC [candidate division KSB1 bacterium]MCB9501449.1 sn-glycerol-3-phosphate ABC transporter ATP-binding protein UgpC [Deferribacteres bacterium]